ncbi:L-lactate dehydrogenase, partial [Dissostichus eleginoides]
PIMRRDLRCSQPMSAPLHCAGRSSLSLLAVWSEATMGATPCLLFVLIIGARILENT